jgi:hypothetical protein
MNNSLAFLLCMVALSLDCGGSNTASDDPQAMPTIVTQPVNQSATEGNTATFSVVAKGTAPLAYQWEVSLEGGAWSAVTGGTTATYMTPTTSLSDNGKRYHVVVRNSTGQIPSDPATLIVNARSSAFPGDVMAAWEGGASYYARWPHGPSTDPKVFPIAVWLQDPNNATAYRNIGINSFVGLWQGPTETQLSSLVANSMPVICAQNALGLGSLNNGIITSWMHADEPDNAQNGTQDPIPTANIVSEFRAMVAKDSSRPVYLNLGQGVACDKWYGRGARTNHPEDYAQYALGADILSFDVYPMNVYPRTDFEHPWFTDFNIVAQNIWYVAIGVDRLRGWTDYQKPVWAWIECTNINGDSRYALTSVHVKAEVWMALIHGARGIGYFSHHWNPFSETGLLEVPEMRDGISAVNAQITLLAPVLNTQGVANGVTTVSSDASIPVDTMVKRADGNTYVFAVAMRPGLTNATFALRGFTGNRTVEVVGESRQISSNHGVFLDTFTSYAVHIYRIANP